MEAGSLEAGVVWEWGALQISSTVVTTWVVMALLTLGAWLVSRRLKAEPGPLQSATEAIVLTLLAAIREVLPDYDRRLLPFIGTLWLFLGVANMVGLVPALHAPTRDLSTTAGLALLVFASVHWYGLRIRGPRRYFHHFLVPNPILLPFHLISEVTRTVALAMRLFGNIMSLEMAALLVLLVAGFLVPVPILMLHIVEGLVQAYIFGMLALVYVAGGIQSQEEREEPAAENPNPNPNPNPVRREP